MLQERAIRSPRTSFDEVQVKSKNLKRALINLNALFLFFLYLGQVLYHCLTLSNGISTSPMKRNEKGRITVTNTDGFHQLCLSLLPTKNVHYTLKFGASSILLP